VRIYTATYVRIVTLNPPQSLASSSVPVRGLLISQAGPALSPSVAPIALALARAHFDLSHRGVSIDRRLSQNRSFTHLRRALHRPDIHLIKSIHHTAGNQRTASARGAGTSRSSTIAFKPFAVVTPSATLPRVRRTSSKLSPRPSLKPTV
jgi:hypothetical protein